MELTFTLVSMMVRFSTISSVPDYSLKLYKD